jgi:hypothetical protein
MYRLVSDAMSAACKVAKKTTFSTENLFPKKPPKSERFAEHRPVA